MNKQEVEELVAQAFPYGVLVLPPGDDKQFPAEIGSVWEDAQENLWLQLWPQENKDLNFDATSLKSATTGWAISGPEGKYVLRPLGEQFKDGVF